ncbi:MAG: tetratricopeptide repeat protein [Bacteriovoracia bacterium]
MKAQAKRAAIQFIKSLVWLLLLSIGLLACNPQAEKNKYILAERLFGDRKYDAAVSEFQKIIENNPRSPLAQQALFRVGIIQYLYLEKYSDAVKSLRQFTLLSQNGDAVYEAEKNIGEIYFSKIEDFRSSLDQYKRILDKYPESKEKDFFLFRIAKSYYGFLDFDNAIQTYERIKKETPKSPLVLEASYQIGNTYYTRGDCDTAIKVFREVVKEKPSAQQAVFSQFGIANCYEEQQKYQEAIDQYEQIVDKHPSKNVVLRKIQKLKVLREKTKPTKKYGL